MTQVLSIRKRAAVRGLLLHLGFLESTSPLGLEQWLAGLLLPGQIFLPRGHSAVAKEEMVGVGTHTMPPKVGCGSCVATPKLALLSRAESNGKALKLGRWSSGSLWKEANRKVLDEK